MALATSESAKPKIIAKGIDPLIKCLLLSDSAAKRNAIQTINYTCEHPSGLIIFVRKLLDQTELLLEVFDINATPALNTIIQEGIANETSDNGIAINHAIRAVERISRRQVRF